MSIKRKVIPLRIKFWPIRNIDVGDVILLATVFTLSLFFAISMFSVSWIQAGENQEAQWSAQRSELEQFANVIAHDVSIYDLDAIDRSTKIVLARPAIESVVIVGKYGDVIHESRHQDPNEIGEEIVKLSLPISDAGEWVGRIKFELQRSAVFREEYSPFARAVWAFIFSSVFGALVIYIYVNRFVSRPLEELQQACERTVETGEHHSANFVANKRFGAYARSFNKMQTKLGTLQSQKTSLLEILTEEQNAIDAYLNTSKNAIFVFNSEGKLSLNRGELSQAFPITMDDIRDDPPKFQECLNILKDRCKPVQENGQTVSFIFSPEENRDQAIDTAILFNIHQLPKQQTAIFAYDITSLRRAENAVAELQKSRALAELTGGIAHDFNNILASISASAECFALDRSLKLDTEQRGTIEHCIKASAMGADLCQQLLAYSRRKVLEETSIDTAQAVEDTAKFLARTVGVNYAIKTRVEASAPIFADYSMFQRSLTNLALNARNAMPNGGMIEFRVDIDKDANCVVVKVFNNGPRIPSEIIHRVFDPFFSTHQNKGGNGLGLSVVKGFVEQSGGKIAIQNEVGGVEVQMTFPLIQNPPLAANREFKLPSPIKERRKNKILLIDDNPLVLNSVSRLLRLQKHEVSTAQSYVEVQEYTRRIDQFDIIISDVMMPEVDGIGIAKEFRRLGHNLPIIFMTGLESYNLKREIQSLGNCYLILKPAKFSELDALFVKIFAEAKSDDLYQRPLKINAK